MPTDDRGGLKAAFSNFNKPESDEAAELKLLGRRVDAEPDRAQPVSPIPPSSSSQIATTQLPGLTPLALGGGLTPKPLYQREPVRQMSFRCPISIAGELRRKAAFNQLEQQEIILEGIKRVVAELPEPPPGWE